MLVRAEGLENLVYTTQFLDVAIRNSLINIYSYFRSLGLCRVLLSKYLVVECGTPDICNSKLYISIFSSKERYASE